MVTLWFFIPTIFLKQDFFSSFHAVLTAQECDWQDKLDKKLTRSTTMAADAEEISEELDALEQAGTP